MRRPIDRCSGEEVACENARIWRHRKAVRPKTRFTMFNCSSLQLQAPLNKPIRLFFLVKEIASRRSTRAPGRFAFGGSRALRREFSQGIWAAFMPLHGRAGLALFAIAKTVAIERLHDLVSSLASLHRREFLGRAAATHDIEVMFSRNHRFQRIIARERRNRAAQRRHHQERKSKTSLLSMALACFAHRRILPRNGFHVKARRRLRAHAGRFRPRGRDRADAQRNRGRPRCAGDALGLWEHLETRRRHDDIKS